MSDKEYDSNDIEDLYDDTENNNDNADLGEESDLNDTNDITSAEMTSLEEDFAADVEAMSFDDLSNEQERIESLSQMNDMDIFAEYDAEQKEQYDPEVFDALTDGLSKDALLHLKEGLANRDPNVMDYFGINESEDGDSGRPNPTRKRSRY